MAVKLFMQNHHVFPHSLSFHGCLLIVGSGHTSCSKVYIGDRECFHLYQTKTLLSEKVCVYRWGKAGTRKPRCYICQIFLDKTFSFRVSVKQSTFPAEKWPARLALYMYNILKGLCESGIRNNMNNTGETNNMSIDSKNYYETNGESQKLITWREKFAWAITDSNQNYALAFLFFQPKCWP